MARIEDHKYTIEEAFRECFYIVPDYQREYVWTEKEVQQLLQDIDEEFDVGDRREYFIGTVLVSPTPQKNHFEVIDGQQRLTTFFLLLCAMRQRFAGEPLYPLFTGLLSTSYTDSSGNLKTSLKLEPRYEHAGELVNRIVVIDADPQTTRSKVAAAGIPKFGSLENLLNAYSTIHSFLDTNYKNVDALRKYWGYLANNVVFIQLSTDVSSALKIFETINERGLGLNSMDLLKNLLFTQVRQEEFTHLKDEWKKITAPLERHKEKALRFLRYFIMANYTVKNQRHDGVVREDEIYDWLTDKDNAVLCGYRSDPFGFVRKIIRNVECYIAFTEGRGNDGAPSLAMDTLQRLCGAAFSLHYVLLLAAANFPKELFDHFVRQLESFLFYYIFTKTPTKDLERNFSVWADELREISEVGDPNTQKDRLNEFVTERLQKSIDSKHAELSDTLKRYVLGSMQQYRTRYLLAKLAQHVKMAFTRAWNLLNALFYKAGKVPWRLLPDQTEYRTNFLGIGFYRDLDGQQLWTSTAQMFDERGRGLILRGARAQTETRGRHPYLTSKDAEELVAQSITTYKAHHRHVPARLVVLKTSRFRPEEAEGIDAALEKFGIEMSDLVWVQESSPIAIFREGNYPVLRGTFVDLEGKGLLYTRGSVPFYGTFPGLRVPRPLLLVPHENSDSNLLTLAKNVLALTKVNWNTTQFDQKLPVPIKAAREVGRILKHVEFATAVSPDFRRYT